MSLLGSINRVVVSVEDLTQALAVVLGIAPEDRSAMEVRFLRLLDHFGGGKRPQSMALGAKVRAIEYRFLALARLHATGRPELKGWSLPSGHDGGVYQSLDLLQVAAAEPLIERDDQFVFDEERFFQRLLEITAEEGQA